MPPAAHRISSSPYLLLRSFRLSRLVRMQLAETSLTVASIL
jgi:hypothetical protein